MTPPRPFAAGTDRSWAWDGQVLGAVLVFHDITASRQLARQLAHDATHDPLTGLVNRAEFEKRLERALSSAQHYGARHALCYLDLDQFKRVNDLAGHAAGDELLKQVNSLLAGMFRERDTLARIGGDEFGLLLDNCPVDRAYIIAEAVVGAVRDYRFHWEGNTYQIGVSIGLVPQHRFGADHGASDQHRRTAGSGRYRLLRGQGIGPQSSPHLPAGGPRILAASQRNAGSGRLAGRAGEKPVSAVLPADRLFERARTAAALRGVVARGATTAFKSRRRSGLAGDVYSGGRTLRPDGGHRPLGDRGGTAG